MRSFTNQDRQVWQSLVWPTSSIFPCFLFKSGLSNVPGSCGHWQGREKTWKEMFNFSILTLSCQYDSAIILLVPICKTLVCDIWNKYSATDINLCGQVNYVSSNNIKVSKKISTLLRKTRHAYFEPIGLTNWYLWKIPRQEELLVFIRTTIINPFYCDKFWTHRRTFGQTKLHIVVSPSTQSPPARQSQVWSNCSFVHSSYKYF